MDRAMTVVVTGATGKQGGAVARQLLARGHRVIAVTRRKDSRAARALWDLGAELAQADFTDPGSLREAVRGAEAVFAMSTPFEAGPSGEVVQATTLLNAVRAEGTPHLVYSSVAGASVPTGIPHFDSKLAVERYLAEQGLPYTIVAPAYFMENLLMPSMQPALREGRLAMPMSPDRPLQMAALSDLAQVVTTVIHGRMRWAGRRIEVASDGLTGVQAAQYLGEALGRDIAYQPVPIDRIRAQSEDAARMFEWFEADGYHVDLPALRREFPDVRWTDFRTWARANAKAITVP